MTKNSIGSDVSCRVVISDITITFMGNGRGGRMRLTPPWILKFSQKGCFFSFEWVKQNIATFGPHFGYPWKI